LVGAVPGADGEVTLRVGSCLAGEVEAVVVAVDRGAGSEPEANVLWRLEAEPGGGPQLESGDSVDVVVGTPPAGMVETTALSAPLPDGETVQVDITMSSQSFAFFFRPSELQAGKIELEQKPVDADDFDGRLDDLCS
jgi:hypothetical protein